MSPNCHDPPDCLTNPFSYPLSDSHHPQPSVIIIVAAKVDLEDDGGITFETYLDALVERASSVVFLLGDVRPTND